jgi:hypothetical protein
MNKIRIITFDKYYGNNNFNNTHTINVTYRKAIKNKSYVQLFNNVAIQKYNDSAISNILKIPIDLPNSIFSIEIYYIEQSNIITESYVFIIINENKLGKYIYKKIKNLDFIKIAFSYDYLYNKAISNTDITIIGSPLKKNKYDNINCTIQPRTYKQYNNTTKQLLKKMIKIEQNKHNKIYYYDHDIEYIIGNALINLNDDVIQHVSAKKSFQICGGILLYFPDVIGQFIMLINNASSSNIIICHDHLQSKWHDRIKDVSDYSNIINIINKEQLREINRGTYDIEYYIISFDIIKSISVSNTFFKLKWDRLIVDDIDYVVNECMQNVIYAIQSNYKWASSVHVFNNDAIYKYSISYITNFSKCDHIHTYIDVIKSFFEIDVCNISSKLLYQTINVNINQYDIALLPTYNICEINNIFKNIVFLKKKISSITKSLSKKKQCLSISCPICHDNIRTVNCSFTKCGHIFCGTCIHKYMRYYCGCPYCRIDLSLNDIYLLRSDYNTTTIKYGSILTSLLNYILEHNNQHYLIYVDECDISHCKDMITEYNIQNAIIIASINILFGHQYNNIDTVLVSGHIRDRTKTDIKNMVYNFNNRKNIRVINFAHVE